MNLAKSYYIIDSTDGMARGTVASILVGNANTVAGAKMEADRLARANPGHVFDVCFCLTRHKIKEPVTPPVIMEPFDCGPA